MTPPFCRRSELRHRLAAARSSCRASNQREDSAALLCHKQAVTLRCVPREGELMPQIYVDADACPVKAEVIRVAERHGLQVYIVSTGGMRPSGHPLVREVTVPGAFDAADD